MKVRIYEQIDGDEVLVRDGRYVDEAVEHYASAYEKESFDATCDEAEAALKARGSYWLNKGRFLLMVDRAS